MSYPPQPPPPSGSPYLGYQGYGATAAPLPSTLGWVALVIGATSLVGSLANAWIVAYLLSPERLNADTGNMSGMLSLGVMGGFALWFCLGLWAIIQGGIAMAQRRGWGQGLGAIGLGLIGPWAGVGTAITLVTQQFA